jgi:type IV pilus assembly protein PilW
MKSLPSNRKERGFTLVELLVGVVVGLIASGAIIQTFSTFEAQKRSTLAGSEAQENGLVALSLMEQDIHNAGAGLADPSVLDCAASSTYTYSSVVGGAIPNFTLAPLVITAGATSTTPDSIQINTGDFIGALPAYLTSPMASAQAILNVSRTDGFGAGDVIIVTQGGNCSVMQVSAVVSITAQLAHVAPLGIYNAPLLATGSWPAYATGAKVVNPKSLLSTTYQVSGNNLQMSTSTTAATPTVQSLSLVRNLVFMKAQYGVAPAGSQSVDTWVNPTGTWSAASLAASPTNRKRIKAVRLVVVARSDKREAATVTTPCTNVSLQVNNGPCAWPDTAASQAPLIDLSANPDWQHYRYKVYQTIVPLRNVIWDNV